MNEQASAWLTAIEGLPAVHDRLRRVVILDDDAVNVIRSQDGPRTLFYVDPPYLHSTRTVPNAYRYEMAQGEHIALLETLAGIEGRFLFSGYPSMLYEKYEELYGWDRIEFEIDNKSGAGTSKQRRIECVWMNFRRERRSRRLKSAA